MADGPLNRTANGFPQTKNKGICKKIDKMDSDNESFHSESEFCYPEELDLKNNQNESNYQGLARKTKNYGRN